MTYWFNRIMVLILLFGSGAVSAQLPKQLTLAAEPWGLYMHPTLPEQGFLVQVAQEALALEGLTVDVQFMPWSRAVELARSGQVDGLLGAYYSEEREQFLRYSHELALVQEVFFVRKESELKAPSERTEMRQYRWLMGYRIGVVRHALHEEKFDYNASLNKVETTDRVQLLDMLVRGRIDIFATSKHVVDFHLLTQRQHLANELRVLTPPLAERSAYLAWSKASPRTSAELNDLFNCGLARLKTSGRYQQLKLEYQVSELK